MKKRILSALLGAAMMLTVVGCGGQAEAPGNAADANVQEDATEAGSPEAGENKIALDGTWPENKILIGFEIYDGTDEQTLNMISYLEYMSQYFNTEIIVSEDIKSAEDEYTFLEQCAAAGCQAYAGFYNVSGTEIIKKCCDKGIYYWDMSANEDIYKEMKDNPYYLSGVDSGNENYSSGRNYAMGLADAGCKRIVYAAGGRDFGVDAFVKRSEGFYDAIKELQDGGTEIEVVYDISGWPGTDAFTAEQAVVMGLEFDGLATSFTAAAWLQPLANADKNDVKIACNGACGDVLYNAANSGQMACVDYNCEEIRYGAVYPLILAAVTGNKYTEADGSAVFYTASRFSVTTADEYNMFYDLHKEGKYFVDENTVASLIPALNPDATLDDLKAVYNVTLEELVAEYK